ncbi:MAG: FGGY-family carbohydrate kinase [Rhizobiaceae bacterium]
MIRLRGMSPTRRLHRRIAERIGTSACWKARTSPAACMCCRISTAIARLGDARALGVVHGLALDTSFATALPALLADLRGAIAPGIRHILDALRQAGRGDHHAPYCGGHLKNPPMMELYANALGCRVMQSAAPEAVLLGTAMAAAAAGGLHENLGAAARAMASRQRRAMAIPPARPTSATTASSSKMHRHRQQIAQDIRGPEPWGWGLLDQHFGRVLPASPFVL